MIRFLCGCTSKLEIPIPHPDNEESRRYLQTFDSIGIDTEGFLICKLHHMRRYGWRVPNHTGKFAGMSNIQYERLVVWNEAPRLPSFDFKRYDGPDLRPHVYDRLLDYRASEAIARAMGAPDGYIFAVGQTLVIPKSGARSHSHGGHSHSDGNHSQQISLFESGSEFT